MARTLVDFKHMDDISVSFKQLYVDAILKGDKKQSSQVVTEALKAGLIPTKVYLDVLMRAQSDIGELWHEGKVSVPQERVATEITINLTSRIRELLKPRAKLGLKAAVSAVFGDQHSIGARAMADFLVMDGWEVDFLGAGTNSEDIVAYLKARGSDLLCVSWVMADRLQELNRLISISRRDSPKTKILVGGGALTRDPSLAEKVKADGFATNPKQGVIAARRICSVLGEEADLELYLLQLGRSIHERRRMLKWSQDQLAEKSGIDRTYLSGLEQGKQNVSISTLVRLAGAFNIELTTLLPSSA